MEKSTRKTIFIKKDLQVKFILFILLAVLFGMVLFGYQFLTFMQDIFKDHPVLLQRVYEEGPKLIYPLIIKSTIFFALLAMVSALLSHRIAGPVYHLERVCREIKEGNKQIRVKLRKGDALSDLANEFNSMLDYITKEENKK
ncbi:MAG: methyl-accepting chemotaxis protein [Elusimicrobiaceae bacterium]|nr:methyl-accepting chemotaxis protein [Elusimicrobiaceae bacterium]